MESALRPRDIQARIRAGESPEDVAAAAQTTVEAIMGFAGPGARRARARRPDRPEGLASAAGPARPPAGPHPRRGRRAATSPTTRCTTRTSSGTPGAARTAAGPWSRRTPSAGGARTAEFTHDLPGRYVVAENDEARVLTGELRPARAAPAAGPAAQPRSAGSPPCPPRTSCRSATTRSSWSATAPAEGADGGRRRERPRRARPRSTGPARRRAADADWIADAARPRPTTCPLRRGRDADRPSEPAVRRADEPAGHEPRPTSAASAASRPQEGPLVGARRGTRSCSAAARASDRSHGSGGPVRSGCRSRLLASNIAAVA